MNIHPLFTTVAARFGRLLLAASLTLLGGAPSARAVGPGFKETRVATGLASPVSITIKFPDPRTFICEKGGKVRIIKNGVLLPTPFLTVPVDTAGDRGLFTMILDQSFPVQHVYVFYTAKTPTIHNRVSRFTVNQSNPDTVIANSELVLLDLPTSTNNFNNGGALVIQGGLLISTGDNGVPANAQSLNSPFGKILKINIHEGAEGTIPDTNPFFNQTTGINRAIWARGFRNPYPMTESYDDFGALVTHDVGNNVLEKNRVVEGGNYGWPVCDGSCTNSGFINPVKEQDINPSSTCPVKGAVFYDHGLFGDDCGCGPDYRGAYFYTNCSGIGIDHTNGFFESFAGAQDDISGLAVDGNGHLWYIERNTGSVYRISLDTPCLTPPTITVQPQPTTVVEGARVTLSAQATSNSGCALSYRWYFRESDGGLQPIPGAFNPTHSFVANQSTSVTYAVKVSNVIGSVTSNEVFVAALKTRIQEAEILPVFHTSGDAVRVINESSASGGSAAVVDANAVNDQVTYQLGYQFAATYTLKVRFKKASNRAKVQVMTGKIDGALSNIGAAVDLYSASSAYQEVTIGNWVVQSTGDKLICFKVTGKNASSSGYSMCIDSITLVPQ